MKRLLAIFLFVTYFVASTGTTMHYHFCMGKEAGWSLINNTDQKKCGKCGMDKSINGGKGCCTDEQKWLKIADDQQAVMSVQAPLLQTAIIITQFLPYDIDLSLKAPSALLPQTHAPPRSSGIAVYKLNRTFRI